MANIKTGKCNFCGANSVPVAQYLDQEERPDGTLTDHEEAVCQRCDPQGFEIAADMDKQRYLMGGDLG